MNLRDTTRDLIAQVEQQTGFMVEVVPEPALATISTVIMAGRRTLPAHVIRYNPVDEHILDRLIYIQCGIVLGFFANPPETRVAIASVPGGWQTSSICWSSRLNVSRPKPPGLHCVVPNKRFDYRVWCGGVDGPLHPSRTNGLRR